MSIRSSLLILLCVGLGMSLQAHAERRDGERCDQHANGPFAGAVEQQPPAPRTEEELAEAIKIAGSFDRKKVRDALYKVNQEGIVQKYAPAFTPDRHNAILPENYKWTAWHNGKLLPAEQTPYK